MRPGSAAGSTSCRNVLAHAGKSGRRVVSAFIATAFAQETPEAASTQWRAVADQIRPKVPKLAAIMDEAEHDVLAYMTFPKEHRAKLHSINPIERLNGEIKRRTEVVGIFPNDDAIVRLVGALLLEQNDEWAVQRARYMTLVWGLRSQAACIVTFIPLFGRGGPFLRPDLRSHQRRAQGRSRRPAGHCAAARSVLDGPEHGARISIGRSEAVRGGAGLQGARGALRPCIRWA